MERERASSSEPCSTRPNPFDDTDTSRKRRRTSLTAASRSRSVESANSSPEELAPGSGDFDPPREASSDSAMKIDTDPAIRNLATTPEPHLADSRPASGPRSSRVTINVRTPSRPLDAIPSSPPSPTPQISLPHQPTDVKISVEESEVDMSRDDTLINTPASSASDRSSEPPIEVLPEEDIEFDPADPEVTVLDEAPAVFMAQSMAEFPFQEHGETLLDTVLKLQNYVLSHDAVTCQIADWIEQYVKLARRAPFSTIENSYHSNREFWQALPELALATNKISAPLRSQTLRDKFFDFHKAFAKLTAFFIEFDMKRSRNQGAVDQARIPDLASPAYAHALHSTIHATTLRTLDPCWGHDEIAEIVMDFQSFHSNAGGSLGYLKTLIETVSGLVPISNKLTDNLGYLCLLVSTILQQCSPGARYAHHIGQGQAKCHIARGYAVYKTMSAALSNIVDRHLTHLSYDGTLHLLLSLTEIYRISLSAEGIVPPSIITEHFQERLRVSPPHVPEAMAYHWKFTVFTKLIMSSQMQLRVMSATQMCNDLVMFWKKSTEHSGHVDATFLQYIADFLLSSGLVAYILGPTCHPEVTIESGNIIGFLVVSKTYTKAHTDALWQTITSTQDPRVSEALIRASHRVVTLLEYTDLIYFCEKMNAIPLEGFGATMRTLCDVVLRNAVTKSPYDRSVVDSTLFDLCVRLIRQASVFGAQSPIAFPDIFQWATDRFREIIPAQGLSHECRARVYTHCLDDIAQRSPYTLGSIWVLHIVARHGRMADLRDLTLDHDLTRLLVEELEAAIPSARAAGFPPVLSGQKNTPRRELLNWILANEPSTITKDIGRKLWHLLVGSGAACQEDRNIAWQLLNFASKRTAVGNPFTSTCFSEYLPSLSPQYFCKGALDFVRESVIPLVNDQSSTLLDDDENHDGTGIEQLWRMVLTAPENTIEREAIHMLVNDIYIESRSILTFPNYRAQKVHLALVDRCLRQLALAGTSLKGFSNGSANGRDAQLALVATDSQIHEQQVLFIRSLSVLREFYRLHQAKSHFTAPDLRSLVLDPLKDIQGELADVKFQAFDAENCTEIRSIKIGKRNTISSLLAILHEATGFENYRVYCRGRHLIPQESLICKTLEDENIQNCLLLVKKEPNVTSPPSRARPGASPVEAEILDHFGELCEYLSMEEKLAREVYNFLVKLPADEKLITAIDDPSTSYTDIFPPGQLFKSLYAVHTLQEYLGIKRRKHPPPQRNQTQHVPEGQPCPFAISLTRVLSLVVSAISELEDVAQAPSQHLQLELSSALQQCLGSVLKDPILPRSARQLLDKKLLDRLSMILSASFEFGTSESTCMHMTLCFQTILECCAMSDACLSAFVRHPTMSRLLRGMLLESQRQSVRETTAAQIVTIAGDRLTNPDATTIQLRNYFWSLVSDMIVSAVKESSHPTELLGLGSKLLGLLQRSGAPTLNINKLRKEWCVLLLDYTTSEDVTQPGVVDKIAGGLVELLHSICERDKAPDYSAEVLKLRGVARDIFWKHLFPRSSKDKYPDMPKPILSQDTRSKLINIIFFLIGNDYFQIMDLLEDFNELVPVFSDLDEMYEYELPQQFEREKAIRAQCGYVGLKNLSNTCYLNSLFTQLFMNVDFRRFMLDISIRDSAGSQDLLFETQKLFAFMQDSSRRFVIPEEAVACIKTYEDSAIDIHNQMDVDEFYNLLFDRWEGQLRTSEEKKQFRSFYGGQLVQQVRSKECEHVSERLEPFSAIQCDIKGKKSLQESLQAYVDGEIMEGENKYKCSTCDRHVDAVKRTCLKDIPDNLIFHLKRFDFNIRTYQRSKLNDFFSFPTTIDMRPYTIEQLSEPETERPEDTFELVGILVHSGTAESGHYYSYVRERPCSSTTPTWVEFNDDAVSPWDPSQMEGSCFGGQDPRSNFNNEHPFDKTYSAYMLFYQRSSSLARAQEVLKQSGQISPLHVPLPGNLDSQIRHENITILRRHCLFDQGHIPFVKRAIQRMKRLTHGECTSEHRMEYTAIPMLLSHLDQVGSRAKDCPDAHVLSRLISEMCKSCLKCSLALFQYFDAYPLAFRMLVQKNCDASVRQVTAELMIEALRHIKAGVPVQYGVSPSHDDSFVETGDDEDQIPTITKMVRNILRWLWDAFHCNLRSWLEVFNLMLSFVRLGHSEKEAFLEEHYLRDLLQIVAADQDHDLNSQFSRMVGNINRRVNRPPTYDSILDLLNELIGDLEIHYNDNHMPIGCPTPDQRHFHGAAKPCFTRAELGILHRIWETKSNNFMEKLIAINQNEEATHSILEKLMRKSTVLELHLYNTLKQYISAVPGASNLNAPYLRVASEVFCPFSTQADLIEDLIQHVNSECMTHLNPEAAAFFEFQRSVYEGTRLNSGDPPAAVRISMLKKIPDWAPGLLGCHDLTVSAEVEHFLQERLFKLISTSSALAGENDFQSNYLFEIVAETAKRLGIACLVYLHENYVARRVDVASRAVAPLERVIRDCSKFCNPGNGDTLTDRLIQLSQGVLEPLRRLTVEEVEEDGSDIGDWENSSGISEQMDNSLGDISMSATGDATDEML